MIDFTYYAPTEVVFGRDAQKELAQLVKKHGGHKVLVHFGGRSAKESGLLDEVIAQLDEAEIPHVELGGVVPNPRLSKVREGMEIVRKEGIDFLLALGGGSVIDSCKAIAYGVPYEGDVWDFFCGKATVEKALPVGCVLTIPASGSEMSPSCVITNEETFDKQGCATPLGRCRFAIMNPERTFSLSPWQTAAGATDIMMHTMERYFSPDDDMDLTDGIAEALVRSVKENVSKVLVNPEDYRARAQIMWAGSLSHNGLTGCGLRRDWACHKMEHELSGLFDVTHGAGLAAIWPSWARYVCPKHIARFVQFAVNVMGVNPVGRTSEETAEEGIVSMERFFRSIGMPIHLPELIGHTASPAEIRELADRCSHGGTVTIGSLEVLGREDMEAIYTLANRGD
ncbi:MAG: iron-containing alcohol dehydrogenase [Bacteroidales bacterium]|nr:iron-containing alcohol dehydrogenase [Bacteroidales bacterium]